MGKRAASKPAVKAGAKAKAGPGALAPVGNWIEDVLLHVATFDPDIDQHPAKVVVEAFPMIDGDNVTSHVALHEGIDKFLKARRSLKVMPTFVNGGAGTFPDVAPDDPFRVPITCLAFREPEDGYPPLLDWRDTCMTILRSEKFYDSRKEPPLLYPADPSMLGKNLDMGKCYCETGFSRMTILFFILTSTLVDKDPDELPEADQESLQRRCEV
jgi:hypothetical protein